MNKKLKTYLARYLALERDVAPLAVFRILFGVLMAFSMARFAAYGWIDQLYVRPQFYFTYYGFEWVKPLGQGGMYALFGVAFLSALFVAAGAFYRVASVVFFLSFTYIELIDKTNYLNHYYFISLVAFLLCFLPAHRAFSFDVWRNPALAIEKVPAWAVDVIKLQLGIVYFYAGIAKVQPDWLIEALPLRMWLPARSNYPVIGPLLTQTETAYFFSWAGCLYDLTIPFFLLWSRTRLLAYAAVVFFHVMTWWLFPIGMFPWIMIFSTLIFFPERYHRLFLFRFNLIFARLKNLGSLRSPAQPLRKKGAVPAFLGLFMFFQLLFPWRFLCYPGHLFWTEQGFRFSWRVMLIEKAGQITFYVRDPETGREGEADYDAFLTPNQIKMMATQPDMILQTAHFLAEKYRRQGVANPEIRAKSYVSLNGRGSRLFIDPNVNLARETESFRHKTWILPFETNQ